MTETFQITRTYEIAAAHRLPHVPSSHKCFRMHGHNFRVVLTIEGPLDPTYGWVVDFAAVDRIWEELVHAALDHRTMNELIPNPTSEIICGWIYGRLAAEVGNLGPRLVGIEVWENDRCSARLRVQSPHATTA